MHQIQGLCPQAHHQNLAFGIAEPHVVFNKPRHPVLDHQPNVKNALKRCSTAGHLCHRGAHDCVKRAFSDRVGHDRRRGICAHTARVRPRVSFADALVILGGADGQNICAVAQHKIGRFLAAHEFFDHDARSGCAKRSANHVINRRACLVDRFRHDDPFARGQPVRFDHNWRTLGHDIGLGRLGLVKLRPGRSGRFGGVTDIFGKGL